MKNKTNLFTASLFLGFIFFATTISGQTTEFTYQGKLNDGAMAANGNYDFEFRLFVVETNGTALGTLTKLNVPVSNGVFTVRLDFGAVFDGSARFLEIAVRPSGSAGGYQQLLPRQPVTSAPYNIRSLSAANADNATNATNAATATNALQLGGIEANQYVQTNDSRLADSRNPLPGSTNYIQNSTTQQALTNFNISGDGIIGGSLTANIVRANMQFNIGNNGVLRVNGGSLSPFSNTFAGVGAGLNSAPTSASGLANSFFGNEAGQSNTTGEGNSFFGYRAGTANLGGGSNSIFGSNAGDDLTSSFNSIFGNGAGGNTTSGDSNSFFGSHTGSNNTTGSDNSFFGRNAGNTNKVGTNLTMIGRGANVSSDGLSFATAIGSNAVVSASNTIALGRSDGTDKVVIYGLGFAGSTTLCRNTSNQISTCSSSLRYKTNIKPFSSGLNLVRRLKPISFDWKDGGMADLGLGAEDVAAIEPLLVNYNKDGQVEGVKYDRIGVVLLNAVKEQQAQIETQQDQIQKQQQQIQQQQFVIDGLKKLVCLQNPQAEVCKEEK